MGKYYKDICWEAIKRMIGAVDRFEALISVIIAVAPKSIAEIFSDDKTPTFLSFVNDHWWWISGIGLLGWFLILLLRENYKMVEIVRPNLVIDYKEGEQSYQQWDPDSSTPRYKLHRIRIFNDGLKPARDISAQIQKINPKPVSDIRGLPIELHVMGRDDESVRNKPVFDLDGKSEKFIDVISLGRREYEANELLYPVGSYPLAQQLWLDQSRRYELKIAIYAGGTKYCEKKFKLKKIANENASLRHKFSE